MVLYLFWFFISILSCNREYLKISILSCNREYFKVTRTRQTKHREMNSQLPRLSLETQMRIMDHEKRLRAEMVTRLDRQLDDVVSILRVDDRILARMLETFDLWDGLVGPL
jgi:uncharacterized protein YaaW (UPF0174 family)